MDGSDRRAFGRYRWRLAAIALGASLLLAADCNHNDVVQPPAQTRTVELRYDGDNASAPQLPADSYEGAARFTPTQTAGLVGGRLIEAEYYIFTAPTAIQLRVYGAGTATTPGALLYAADVTAGTVANAWNTHILPSPVTVPAGDLWISIAFSQSATQRTLGCDPGPAVPDGDWLYAAGDGNWIPLIQRYSGAVNINWNVRGVVQITE